MSFEPDNRSSLFEQRINALLGQGKITPQRAKQLFEQHLSSIVSFKQTPKDYRVYARGFEQTPVQTLINLDFNNRSNNNHPAPVSKLECLEPKPALTYKEKRYRDSLSYAGENFERIHNSKARDLKNKRQTLHRLGWRDPLKEILKERGIDIYEWETSIKPSQGVPDEILPKVSKEYLDYRRNVKRLFPEYYQGYKR